MTPIEKAQMWHLKRRWHQRADELLEDEFDSIGWYMLDLIDVYGPDGATTYTPAGKRRLLDA